MFFEDSYRQWHRPRKHKKISFFVRVLVFCRFAPLLSSCYHNYSTSLFALCRNILARVLKHTDFLVYPRGSLGSWKTRFCHVSLFFARFVSTLGVLYSAPKGLRTFSLFFCTKCGCTFGLCNSHKNCQKHKRSKRSAPHHRGDTPKVQKDIYRYVSELPAAMGELPQKKC